MPATIVMDRTDGFVDFGLPIISSSVSEDGEAELLVGGLIAGELIELRFHVKAGILPNDLMNENLQSVEALHDGIKMRLDGEPGRNFVRFLAKCYGSPRTSFLMPVVLSFTAVAIQGDPAKLANELVKIKLFHEAGSTDEEEGPDYFEMFFNADLPNRMLGLNEKDMDFRPGVLNAFPPEPN
jgi:hypothetical protein